MGLYQFLKFLHILAVVFMAAPLYNLIVVNERVRFGKAHLQVDQYFENIIRGNSTRCYIFQLTALVTGLLLVGLGGSWLSLFTNWVLLAKLLLLLVLMGLLSVVHFSIQPRIDRLLSRADGETIPQPIAAEIAPLRLRRKRLASVCLFLVIITVLLGLQVFSAFWAPLTVVLVVLAALFAWRVYKTPVPYGWA
ncbi:MAG: hypothetical protein HYV61_01015 [Candidatus Rokubacteria bacterium]|nr:hypothetical protein [Candidatus Rokubacteria bacterium]